MAADWLSVLAALNTNGSTTPFRALAQLYGTVEVRTSVTPAVSVDVAGLDGGTGGPGLLMQVLRPTVVLSGPAGTKVVAPAGEAPRYGGLVLVAGVVTVLGVAFALGVVVGGRT